MGRGDEGVAHADLGRDVARAIPPVAKDPAQARHVEAQAAVLHDHVGPDPLQELALRHHSAGLLHEGGEQVEGATSDFDRRAIMSEQALTRKEREGTEFDPLGGRHPGHIVHCPPPFRIANAPTVSVPI